MEHSQCKLHCEVKKKYIIQLNLVNADTKGTEPIVRFTEVSVL